jgi:hypothetical protein
MRSRGAEFVFALPLAALTCVNAFRKTGQCLRSVGSEPRVYPVTRALPTLLVGSPEPGLGAHDLRAVPPACDERVDLIGWHFEGLIRVMTVSFR